ncbi:MAG: hypothetical protein HYU51_07185 [Candidatus Rokubacteria bacterium]|nr:hypothetical protein [Candidatus Rokubacteria bacterium]
MLLLPRVLTDRRAGYAGWLALLHPAALVATAAMALAAACPRAEVEWRGRRYAVSDRPG